MIYWTKLWNCAGDIFSIINKCIFSFALRSRAREKCLGRLDLIDWLREHLLIIFDSATDFFQMKYVYSKELPYSWQNNTTLCRGKPFSRENDIVDDATVERKLSMFKGSKVPKMSRFSRINLITSVSFRLYPFERSPSKNGKKFTMLT